MWILMRRLLLRLARSDMLVSGAGLVIGGVVSGAETFIGLGAGGVQSASSSTSTRLLSGWVGYRLEDEDEVWLSLTEASC